MTDAECDRLIHLAWTDRVSFEEIEKETGLREPDVIRLMRRELSPNGFRRWRRRVSGRTTKHRKRSKRRDRPDQAVEHIAPGSS